MTFGIIVNHLQINIDVIKIENYCSENVLFVLKNIFITVNLIDNLNGRSINSTNKPTNIACSVKKKLNKILFFHKSLVFV